MKIGIALFVIYMIGFFVGVIMMSGCTETDRLVTVHGIQGPAGPQGPQGEPGLSGATGEPGASCTVEQAEGGAYIYCSDETSAFISNGTPGVEGPQGIPGQLGVSPTLTTYSLISCTQIAGTSYWAKNNGSTVAFYDSTGCHSSDKEFEMTEGDSLWLSSTALAVYLSGGFRLIGL